MFKSYLKVEEFDRIVATPFIVYLFCVLFCLKLKVTQKNWKI